MSNYVFGVNESAFPNELVYLRRPHIHDLLKKSIQKPVVTVVAGAGYGKTQAVYMFLKEYEILTAWMQLTLADNLSARFWDNFVNTLSLSNEKLASSLKNLGFPETVAKFDMFLSYFSEYSDSRRKRVIVYDDFHLLREKKILQFIEKFFNLELPALSFVLISRSEPDVNAIRLLAQNKIAVITESDLRFSQDDMIDYYEMQNIHISSQLIPETYSCTEGWIMAIRLLELSIKKGVPHEKYALKAMRLNIYKLIESDVSPHLSGDAKVFLAKLSLFDSLPSELVETLSSGNKEVINALSRINSFVRFDSFSNMYYIHHLFMDFLRQEQDLLSDDEKTECYQKAADWYASNGYIIDAITYYGKARKYARILEIALYWPYASAEEGALVLEIMDNAPKEVYDDPMLALLHARAHYFLGNLDQYMKEFEAIIRNYENLPPTRENAITLNKLYALAGLAYYYLSNHTNDFHFVDYITRAYEYCKAESVPMESSYTFQDIGAFVLRISSEKKEDMDVYMDAVRDTADCASKMMPGCMCGMYDLTKAELYYIKSSLQSAEKSAYLALHKAREHQQHAIAMRAIFYLLRISLAQGNYAKSQDRLKELDVQLKIDHSPVFITLSDIAEGWFYSSIGLVEKIANWIKNDSENVNLNAIASGAEFLAKIKYYLCEKKHYELSGFLELQESNIGIQSFLFGKISMAIIKAVCSYHMGNKDDAVRALNEAYRLAEPNALIMQFIEMGNDMVALTKYAKKSDICIVQEEWMNNIQKKSSTYAKKISQVSTEYKMIHKLDSEIRLTQKELQLLNDVFQGLTREEIALIHNMSPSYVKNRLQAIYAKLGAKNANDAIRIALKKNIIR